MTVPSSVALPWPATAAHLLLGGVLVMAGALEPPDPAEAVRAVRAYRLLPGALAVLTVALARWPRSRLALGGTPVPAAARHGEAVGAR